MISRELWAAKLSTSMNSSRDSLSTEHLTTEAANPSSSGIDQLSSLEIVRLMTAEEASVTRAIAAEAENIARAIEIIAAAVRSGGRLIYIGAGTSGRLGVLDASECPPTFNTPPELVVGLIAGGDTALRTAVEGAEDHPEDGAEDLRKIDLSAADVVVGITTSGRTPYVMGALEFARSISARTIALTCNSDSAVAELTDLVIAPVVGPEIITGSTRLKAGTATKLVLNMLSTGTMVLTGRTYGNLMVDLRATNTKLADRSRRLVAQLTGLTPQRSEEVLADCGGELKTAVVMVQLGVDAPTARDMLKRNGDQLRRALENGATEATRD